MKALALSLALLAAPSAALGAGAGPRFVILEVGGRRIVCEVKPGYKPALRFRVGSYRGELAYRYVAPGLENCSILLPASPPNAPAPPRGDQS